MGPTRSKQSEAEISALPPIGTTDFEQALRDTGNGLTAETLVYVIRAAAGIGATTLMFRCGQYLTGVGQPARPLIDASAAERVIWAAAKKFGFLENSAILEEFWTACLEAMWKAILLGTDRKPYWEENFQHAMQAKCIDVGRPMYRRWRKMVELDSVPELASLQNVDDVIAVLGAGVIMETIRRLLPPQEAHAAMLHWVEGRPIDSSDAKSVRNTMGLSARRVHTLIANARQRLALDPTIAAMRKDQ